MREFSGGLQKAESCPVAARLTRKARAIQPRCKQGATRSGCSLRGPTWAMGDDFTSKQVNLDPVFSNPHHIDAVSDPACHFDVNSDPAFHSVADPDPSFPIKAQNLKTVLK
jgi:hypothetical protein